MNFENLSLIFWIILPIPLIIGLFLVIRKNLFYTKKYSKIIDIDIEVEKSKKEEKNINKEIEKLRKAFKDKKVIYDKLIKQVAIFNEEIELAELGFYKPHYDFDTSEEYKDNIYEIKEKQKEMMTDKTAIYCNTEWTLDGNKAKGKTMTNRAIKLTSRAFNNECDLAIANVRWNNIERMQQRIDKTFNTINKLNESNQLYISIDYLSLKLKELRLTHEYKEKKQEEKEEQAEIRQQMRDEAKLIQEIDKAQDNEDKYQDLLSAAKYNVEQATGAKLDKLMENIKKLEQDLKEAHSKNERAKSMAEQTKSGHVYIISNIGSFGDNVYKIGMTRRLEPLDRVKELGDASVPFIFDVHAMIYSDNAPELEKNLHKVFNEKRVNLVDNRKEFFNISLEEIEKEAVKISVDVEFIKTIEARDYFESKAIRLKKEDKEVINNNIPEAI